MAKSPVPSSELKGEAAALVFLAFGMVQSANEAENVEECQWQERKTARAREIDGVSVRWFGSV